MKVHGITEVNDIAPVKFVELRCYHQSKDRLGQDEAIRLGDDIFSS